MKRQNNTTAAMKSSELRSIFNHFLDALVYDGMEAKGSKEKKEKKNM